MNPSNIDNHLISNYKPASAFDELLTEEQPKAHWLRFADELGKLSPEALEQVVRDIRYQLKENGVTYTLNEQSSKQKRAWLLDVIPNIIAEDDWQGIEQGIEQRAQLFKFILDDCYGEQSLIKQGIIPAEIIYAHRGYLRPVQGLKPDLSLYATDVARGVDGRMWIVSDRTQVPSGMGFTLENRTVMSKVFPSFFQDSGRPGYPFTIARLSHFFRAWQNHMAGLSPRKGIDPNIVLLSPGPDSETYFEHAYLADYLDYALVQGDDLSVRGGVVYRKTIQGLEQVDVMLRRVDDVDCDPLELSAFSRYGTPGLLEAVRRGQIRISNALGSSVLENPGLLPFLPAVAQFVLNEPLKLPSVATWWCGTAKERQHVLANLGKLIVKRIDRRFPQQTFFTDQLGETELAELRAQIQAEPYLYVGQEVLEHATSPVFSEGGLKPRHTLLRCFAMADDETYRVMPGGLSRSSTARGNSLINNRSGGLSKDTWVLTRQPLSHQSLWLTSGVRHSLTPSSLASRTADNLFWVGRYAERCEAQARLMKLVAQDMTDSEQSERDQVVLQGMLTALAALSQRDTVISLEDAEAAETSILELSFEQQAGGLHQNLSAMLQAAFAVKSAWSSDSWRVLSSCEDLWDGVRQQSIDVAHLTPPMNDLIALLMAFAGLNSESMSQGLGWRFLDMGRRLERAKAISTLVMKSLTSVTTEADTSAMLEKLLTVSENIISYRRKYRSFLDTSCALDLVVFDERNPRALAFQLGRLEEHLKGLPQSSGQYPLSDSEKLILRARTALRLADSQQLSQLDEEQQRSALSSLLSLQIELLDDFSNSLARHYFSHTQTSRQLAANPQVLRPKD